MSYAHTPHHALETFSNAALELITQTVEDVRLVGQFVVDIANRAFQGTAARLGEVLSGSIVAAQTTESKADEPEEPPIEGVQGMSQREATQLRQAQQGRDYVARRQQEHGQIHHTPHTANHDGVEKLQAYRRSRRNSN